MRYGVYGLGVALILVGGGLFIVGSENDLIRSMGSLLAVAGALLIRRSRLRTTAGRMGEIDTPRQRPGTGKLGPFSGEKTGPGRVAWMVAGGSAANLLIAYYFLVQDAQHGHSQAWPIYFLLASGLAFIVGFGYLISKIM